MSRFEPCRKPIGFPRPGGHIDALAFKMLRDLQFSLRNGVFGEKLGDGGGGIAAVESDHPFKHP